MEKYAIIQERPYRKQKGSTDLRAIEFFEQTYKKSPQYTAFTPYRICPIGAHSDHQLGKITGFAIDKGIHIAYGPKENGVVEIRSLQFDKRAQWHVEATPKTKENDWADHLRGATIALHKRYPLRRGLCAVLDGELPIGGLSSSAAVIITFLSALSRMNGITLSPDELITIAKEAENKYVGVSCGKLDQSCEVYCRREHLLYMDLMDDSYELIPRSPHMKPYKIAIFFSGLERSLAGSAFNMRVDECRSAAYALKAYAGMEYGKFEETNLRDVPVEVYHQYKDRLPDNWRKRAEHWYTEFDRVQRGAEAWRRGDIEEFGRLSFESGRSSIYNWETGSPELKALYEIMLRTDGIYGGRFSGAGFKGCCMALIHPDYEESIRETVTREYLRLFPALEGKYSACFCESADGVKLQ
jgi:galactokinase/galacturonokinase